MERRGGGVSVITASSGFGSSSIFLRGRGGLLESSKVTLPVHLVRARDLLRDSMSTDQQGTLSQGYVVYLLLATASSISSARELGGRGFAHWGRLCTQLMQ